MIGSIAALIYYVPQSSIATLWKNVTDYVTQMQEYNTGHDERFADMKIDETQTLAAKTKGTIIVVIGEND